MPQHTGTFGRWVLIPVSTFVLGTTAHVQAAGERDPDQTPQPTVQPGSGPRPGSTASPRGSGPAMGPGAGAGRGPGGRAGNPHEMMGPGRGRGGMMMGRGGGGWGGQGPYQRLFDPTTVTTIEGRITAVQTLAPMQGMSPGVHVLVRTDGDPLPVHLGPQWFIDNLDTRFEVGDTIRVTGSHVEHMGQSFLIASRVAKGDEVLELRDARGFPAWSWRSETSRPAGPSRSPQQQQQR